MNMEDINAILAKQDAILDKLTEIVADHEVRIRGLEQYKYSAVAVIAAVVTLANFVLPYFRK